MMVYSYESTFRITSIQKFSTFSHYNKDRLVYRNNGYLIWETYDTHKYWVKNAGFSNVKTGGI